ncbi:hypothetical protein [Methanobrevibacter olleyae]|uniref:Uncharacterized protein n=1 Tax=Methanobrevibacter olleyae TaxID=294671 RepID=A0A1I4HX79_METOL|nr:hypothetical protein [Methanobrevibacter olleyae]SFL46231.1 hypothetical protein SAMN02910297_00953 [Methanobrevibacter olleyae]
MNIVTFRMISRFTSNYADKYYGVIRKKEKNLEKIKYLIEVDIYKPISIN